MPLPSGIDHIVKTFGRDTLERRLSQHAVAAQSDAMAFETGESYGLAMLRRRDETLLVTMREEVKHVANLSRSAQKGEGARDARDRPENPLIPLVVDRQNYEVL